MFLKNDEKMNEKNKTEKQTEPMRTDSEEKQSMKRREARSKKQPLLIIAGPTAVGKSSTAVLLAKALCGEVISADSMQVYRGMDIGTAKVTKEEMQGVTHHLIDVIEPGEDYNVVRFQEMARVAVRETASRGKLPILCGGTGFYIQALLYDIDFTEEPDAPRAAEIRKRFLTKARAADTECAGRAEAAEEKKNQPKKKADAEEGKAALSGNGALPYAPHLREKDLRLGPAGIAYLHERLMEKDPEAAEKIPAQNVKRTLRALEFYELHGKKISEHNREQEARKEAACPYDYRFFVLTDERSALYARIDKRVDDMIKQGLVQEVKALMEAGIKRESTAMQGIGYRELYAALSGECSLPQAIEKIKQNSRHYAKRQLTWFKREQNVIWIDRSKTEDIIHEIRKYL